MKDGWGKLRKSDRKILSTLAPVVVPVAALAWGGKEKGRCGMWGRELCEEMKKEVGRVSLRKQDGNPGGAIGCWIPEREDQKRIGIHRCRLRCRYLIQRSLASDDDLGLGQSASTFD